MQYEIVSPVEGRTLRRAFVDKFADKNLPHYRIVMGYGDFYGTYSHKGLLWEVIRPYKFIKRSVACKYIAQYSEVYIMWDYPLAGTSRKLQKSRVIKAKGSDVGQYLNGRRNRESDFRFLPADIYVFDKELTFHITFTRVNFYGYGNVCLTSLSDLDDYGMSPLLLEMFELIDKDEEKI